MRTKAHCPCRRIIHLALSRKPVRMRDKNQTPRRRPRAARPTPQESLQQLEESLQRVGINPQSLSLIRRVQLLNLSDDPLALEEYFQSPTPVAVQTPQGFESSSSHSISNKSVGSASIGVSSGAEDFAPVPRPIAQYVWLVVLDFDKATHRESIVLYSYHTPGDTLLQILVSD
jgi:hypothetical protein